MNIKLRKPGGIRLLISLLLLGVAVILGLIAPNSRADSAKPVGWIKAYAEIQNSSAETVITGFASPTFKLVRKIQ